MIKEVGVVGAGVMGHGIAELIAINGYNVIISDVNDEILKKALEKVRWSLDRLEKKGEIKETSEKVMSRIHATTDLNDFYAVDLVIEAVKEKSEIKRQVFQKLGSVVKENAILSSNTSTIPITELGKMAGTGSRFIGIHFSNPPVIMPIVEVIKGDETDEKTLKETKEFVLSIKKEYVVVNKDIPGFLINRLNDRTILESMAMLEEGIPIADIDGMSRFRLGFPMGMCELLDFVGIDTVYYANREMVKRGFNSRATEVLKEKVESNRLGSKTGEGFYKYEKAGAYSRPRIVPNEGMYGIDPLRLLAPAINEATWLIRNEVCSADDVDKAMKMAMNWPHGPLEYADKYGIDKVVQLLRERWESSGESRYQPDEMLLNMIEKGSLGQKSGRGFRDWNFKKLELGPVDLSILDSYALIELNRPDKLNSLNEAMWSGLKDALESVKNDQTVRSVVITGKGRAFCAGDDIEMMDSWKEGSDAKLWMQKFADPLIEVLADYPKPIISAVNGIAFGGGCELNVMFDIVLAGKSSLFAIPEGLIGALPPIASSFGYALINRKFARYALTGEWFTSDEAKNLGLVDVVVPDNALNSAVVEFTEKVSRIAPLSASSIKSTVNLVRSSFKSHGKFGSDELVTLASSMDFKEGQRAFLAKQLPRWEGR